MLRRTLAAFKDPSQANGNGRVEGGGSATAGGYGILQPKKFSTPFRKRQEEVTGKRKRNRIDYSAMGGGGGDDGKDGDANGQSDDDENEPDSKKQKKGKKNAPLFEGYKGMNAQGEVMVKIRKFDKFEAKRERGVLPRTPFAIPAMKTKTGGVVRTALSGAALGARRSDVPPRPLFDPMGDHLIVLWDPTKDDKEAEAEKARLQQEQAEREQVMEAQEDQSIVAMQKLREKVHKSLADILKIKKRSENDIPIKVPVCVDPRLGKILRPHQIEGVKFLYECTTGMKQENIFGCIMADEMGLGKTLQCIALMWTLLKQSPIPRKPTIDKAIIACPASLVRNWVNELSKWLGHAAPGHLALDGKLSKDESIQAIHRWCDLKGRAVTQPVLIVSYETLRNLTSEFGDTEVGLLLCDEGHRLKNLESGTFKALTGIKVKRRVILSGTPIQNDLLEYYSLLSFANPDLLGDRLQFKRNFENAILKGHNKDATDKERLNGTSKLKELSALVSKFIIRRTNDLLTKYLPVKYEHVVFCHLSDFQRKLYSHFVNSSKIQGLLKGKESQPLMAIGILKKLCNHPDLVDMEKDLRGSDHLWPAGYLPGLSYSGRGKQFDPFLSGKMAVLYRFLANIRATSNDKIVLISNYTQTLDIFGALCRLNQWKNFRLDGSQQIAKRQQIVDRFNDPDSPEWIFLLSSKAGGCGINLIGANRLVLFDPDWNPAADQQALARVWRDGQKKECFVYRFMGTGTIEEKIFQRQSHKQALSKNVVDQTDYDEEAGNEAATFSVSDLRTLFQYADKTVCQTHDSFACKRCSNGRQVKAAPALLYGDTGTWNHYGRDDFDKIHDDVLRNEAAYDDVSFVFQYRSQV